MTSFTFNLVHYLMELGAEVQVERNDTLSATEALATGADAFLISPGPCTPNEAGISLDLVAGLCRCGKTIARRLPGPSKHWSAFRRQGDPRAD